MPFENRYQPGSINQIGQGLRGPGERRGWSETLSAHFASSVAYGTAGAFQRPPYFFNQLNPLFYGPSSELRAEVPSPLIQQQSVLQQIQGYRSPYWQGISGLHPGNKGYGTAIIRNLTDFGSGFNREKALDRASGFFTNPAVTGLAATSVLGVPSFHDPVRVGLLAAQSAALGYARGGFAGAAIGLTAFYGLDKAGQAINAYTTQGEVGKPTTWDIMRHFMLYGLVEGGLSTGTSAAFLKGSPIRPMAAEAVGFIGGIRGAVTGTPFERGSNITGLAPEFQEYASPFRRWYQSSIVRTAEFLNKPRMFGRDLPIPPMSEDFAMKFSEAFHGEAAYTLRAVAESGGGIRDVTAGKFYKALAKDIAIGSLGGLVENTLVGAAYLGITGLLGQPRQIAAMQEENNTIEGLHPGAYGTMGSNTIQGMTAFGSKIDLRKAVNWHDYQGLSLEARSRFLSTLAKVPGANIISFDIESTGLQTPLELVSSQRGRLTEFGIVTQKAGVRSELHGFTQHASMSEYTKLYLEGGSFSKEFAKAGRRYAQYMGTTYKASDILEQIVSRIQPGQTNILAGHNITFDLKHLSAELAMERGHVTPAMLEAFYADPRQMLTINNGWQKAADEIHQAITSKDANVQVLDTLGGKYGKHPKVFPGEAAHGLAADYTQGFTPGLANVWEEAGVEKQSIPYALGAGRKLEDIMGYFGIPFKGQAHGPVSDAAATIDLLQGLAGSSRVKDVAVGIEAQSTRVAAGELESYASYQAAFQRKHLLDPNITEGAIPLAETMSRAFPEKYIRPAKTYEEAFTRLPTGMKWAAAGVGLGLAYAAYRMVFAPTQKERNTQIEGLHPGAPRPGYMYGTGFGSGKILEEIVPLATEALMGTKPAVRTGTGEIFKAANHGEAFLKAMNATSRFSEQYMGNKMEQGFFVPGTGFISRSQAGRHGFETSEDLYKLQGMHPGDKGYGTAVVRGMTDFGSGWDVKFVLAKFAQAQKRNGGKIAATIDKKYVVAIKDMDISINDDAWTIVKKTHDPIDIKQMHTAGLMHVMGDSAIKHNQISSRIGV